MVQKTWRRSMIHLFIIYLFLATHPFTSALPARAASTASMAVRLPPAEAKYNGVEPRLLRASSMSPAFKGKQTATLNRGVRCEEHSWIFVGAAWNKHPQPMPTKILSIQGGGRGPPYISAQNRTYDSWKPSFLNEIMEIPFFDTHRNLRFW